MPTVRELRPLSFDFQIYSADQGFYFPDQWHASTGVPSVDLNFDVRNLQVGTGATVSLKPAIQYAATRIDRSDDPVLITSGSPVNAVGLTKYGETLAASSKFFFRVGVGFKLTAGSFARVRGILYGAHRSLGIILPAEEVVMQPTNDVAVPSIFRLGGGRAFPTVGADKLKLAMNFMGNLNGSMEWASAVRAFNDPLARGDWTLSAFSQLASGDVPVNSGEMGWNGLTISSYQWLEIGLALRKATDGSANSRAIVQVLSALKYLG